MTLLEAMRIERDLKRYRALTLQYWAAVKNIDYGPQGWMAGAGVPLFEETAASRPLRQQLVALQPQIMVAANNLGVGVKGTSVPAPAVGGVIVPFNYLTSVTNFWTGHSYVTKDEILDVIDRCIGAAAFARNRLSVRLLTPWCWLVDIPALIVGWPFVVLRNAGVPDKLIEGTTAQGIKIGLTGLLWLGGFVYAAKTLGLIAAIKAVLAKP